MDSIKSVSLSPSRMKIVFFIIGITEILYIRCQVTILVEPTSVQVDETVLLTCRYSGAGPESGVKWFRIGDSEGVIYKEQTAPNCIYFFGGSAYNLTRFTTTCDKAGNNYTLSFKVLPSDLNTMWCCSYIIGGDIFCDKNASITEVTTSSQSPPSTPCQSVLLFALIILYIQCVIIIIVVVIFKCTDVSSVQTYVGSVAHFNFMLTEDSNEVLIKNKSGSVVMIARGKKGRSGNRVYRGRVKFTGNTNQKLISFILRNVTLSDAGIYIAVHSDANRIIGCQALIVKGPTCEDKPPEPDGKIPEQVPLKQIGPTCEDKPPEPHGPTCEDKPPEPHGCKRPYILGLVLGLGLGITFIVGCIIIAILISTGTTSCKYELGLGLGLGSGIPCVITIIIVVIIMLCLFSLFEGIPNIYKFGEGILDGFVIGIIVKRLKCKKPEQVPLEPTEVSSIQTHVGSEANFNFMLTEDSNESEVHIKNKSGVVVMIARGKEGKSGDPVYKGRVNFTGNTNQKLISFILRNVTLSDAGIYIADIAVHSDANRIIGCQMLIVKDTKGKTKNSGSSSAVSRDQVQVQMENKDVKDDDEERPPAVHTGIQNKVDPSKQTKDRQQPVPPANTGFEDNPTFRPLPPPPQKGEIKDRNVRGISATIGDTQDLASETPRPNKLPPILLKQETVQEENVSEESKKKRKKKRKKDQMNVETPEEENGETDLRLN